MRMLTPSAGDLDAISSLLSEAALPGLERSAFRAEDFRIVHDGLAPVGAIGVERYDNDGLLRSLVVAPLSRGNGLGEALVREIEHHAHAIELSFLYLLTTTAGRFFERLGYERIQRGAAPEAVQRSTEFSTLCPASAICMRKAIGGGVVP